MTTESIAGDEPTEAAAQGQPDPLAQYRRWAAVLFAILGLVGTVAAAAVLGGVRVPWPLFAILVAGALVSVGTFLLLAQAIGDRRTWAVRAIAPVCLVLVLFGAIRAAVSLAQGDLLLPLEAFGALMVLSRPHGDASLPLPSEHDRWMVSRVVAALVLATVLPAAASSRDIDRIIGGGPDALRLAVTIDCTTIAADPQAAIPIRADWSWRTTPLFPAAEDGLVVRWELWTDQLDEAGDPIRGVLRSEQRVSASDAISSGTGFPSANLIDPIEAMGPSWAFVIDVPRHGSFDGWVELAVAAASPQARHGAFDAWAVYANSDRWTRESDVASCHW